MFSNSFGVLVYLLLPNDVSWRLLSNFQKWLVFERNKEWNSQRPDFLKPQLYREGRSFDTEIDRLGTPRGMIIQKVLEYYKPRSVLEIGYGSGFYTRQIVEYKSVQKYMGIDICPSFKEFLEQRLRHYQQKEKEKDSFEFKLLTESANLQDSMADAIVLLSCIHHIPNRRELLEGMAARLNPEGIILAIDPTHYIFRIFDLLCKFIRGKWIRRHFYIKRHGLPTHNYCTLGEYRRICKHFKNLHIHAVEFFGLPQKIKQFLRLMPANLVNDSVVQRYLSTEMAIVLRKSISVCQAPNVQ